MTPIDYIKAGYASLNQKHLQAALLCILLSLFGALPGILNSKLTLFNLLLGGPISLGLSMYFLEIVRGGSPGIERSFDGFKHYASATIAYIGVAVVVALGFICLIIPGFILAFGLSQTMFILADNPHMTGIDAIKASWDKMIGYKMDYFIMCLLLIVLVILGFLCFIIGVFFVIPIVYASSAMFYVHITKNESK